MLPRQYRLPLEPGARFLGQPHHAPSFTLIKKLNSLSHPRLAVIVPKSTVKLSTHRHRLVRQLHAEFMHHVDSLPALDLLLIVKTNTQNQLQFEFLDILSSLQNTKY